MKASSLSNALRVLVAARRPVFIWGGPGVGKSSVVKQLAEALNVPLQDVRALLLDPVDLRGLPFVGSDGRSKWATPEFLPQNGSGIFFLDELNAAPAMVQASCYQLVLDRKLGRIHLAGRLGDCGRRAIEIRTVPPRRGCPHRCGIDSFISTSRLTCRSGPSGPLRRICSPK